MNFRRVLLWTAWGVLSVTLSGFLGYSLVKGDKRIFLIGATTSGHHQIEIACEACHVPFGGVEAMQKACVNCHGEELKAANDTHPKSKFTDPRNADRVAILDARLCVTCHREHRPEITRPMAVTMPTDYCYLCHKDIAKERPSHAGLAFDTCASAGCHNFHDNRALYEEFLAKHLDEPPTLATPAVFARVEGSTPAKKAGPKPLAARDADAPTGRAIDSAIVHDWATTAHARAGVNCGGCHQIKDSATRTARWVDKPDHAVCATCHEREAKGFLEGKHGMRLAQKLPPMTPAMARIPMRADARDTTLGCTTCHGAHAFDTKRAAVEACESCHADGHTKAFRASPHFALWQAERAGAAPPGSGVSCATCHLPRELHKGEDGETVAVQHNQNLNLRPNEKMVRSVCLACHGLGFALDALADPRLIANNFKGRPAHSVESIAWVKRRLDTMAAKANDTRRP